MGCNSSNRKTKRWSSYVSALLKSSQLISQLLLLPKSQLTLAEGMVGRADVALGKFHLTVKKAFLFFFSFFFLRAMLPKSLEQAPTSQAGGIETQSQGDPCGYKSGVCIIAFLILFP